MLVWEDLTEPQAAAQGGLVVDPLGLRRLGLGLRRPGEHPRRAGEQGELGTFHLPLLRHAAHVNESLRKRVDRSDHMRRQEEDPSLAHLLWGNVRWLGCCGQNSE